MGVKGGRVVGWIPARFHTFVEINSEILPTLILLPLIQIVLMSVTSESTFTKYLLTTLSSLPRENVVRLMTIST